MCVCECAANFLLEASQPIKKNVFKRRKGFKWGMNEKNIK